MRKKETPRALIYKGFQAFLALVSVKLGFILSWLKSLVNEGVLAKKSFTYNVNRCVRQEFCQVLSSHIH